MRGAAVVLLAALAACVGAPEAPKARPNVLFLAVDDMKDWVGCLEGYEGRVHTPSIDRLAERGTLFTNAHCPSPKCAPSRAAIMTGRMPSTTGLYDNGHWWRPNLPEVVTLPAHFRAHGYRVAGAGKIYPSATRDRPAVIEYRQGNAAVRSRRYRLIRYRDGGEELYDHEGDPLEWSNLAADPRLAAVKARLAEALPRAWAEPAPKKKAFVFDPESFTWTHRETGRVTRGR